jgi:hypothetical protein
MIQKFEFTTAAMAAALEETGVTYEELEDIEAEFEDVETEISESCCMSERRVGYAVFLIVNDYTSSPPTSPTEQAPVREAQQDRLAHSQFLAPGH